MLFEENVKLSVDLRFPGREFVMVQVRQGTTSIRGVLVEIPAVESRDMTP